MLETISNLSAALHDFIVNYFVKYDYTAALYFNDSNLTSYLKIENSPTGKSGSGEDEYGCMSSIEELDKCLTHAKSV